MNSIERQYFNRHTGEVAKFAEELKKNASSKTGVFDSAAGSDFVSNLVNQHSDVKIPADLQVVLDEAGDKSTGIISSIVHGMDAYKAQHGIDAPGDVIEQAFHNAYSTTNACRLNAQKSGILDAVASTSDASNPLSLQPNRAVVSILSAFAEAIPFAHYLPADIGSNEARLAILSHRAGSTFGAYTSGDILDGIGSGDPYLAASRCHTSTPSSGQVTGKITLEQTDGDTCNQSGTAAPILAGRTVVYVNGLIAAREMSASGAAANSPISGSIKIGSTEYAISGTINTGTGEYTLNTTPNLPDSVPVCVEAFIDYEKKPALTPAVIAAVETFSLYAKPWRAKTWQTIDTRTQMMNELGLDPYSESVVAIQGQFQNERHYDALRKGLRIAKANNVTTFDYSLAAAHQDNVRGQVWADFVYPLYVVSQKMAEDTMNHGVTHLYVGKRVAAQLRSMPQDYFTPSGIADRPGIYRIGRLFGQFEVYYTPKVLTETESAAEILCVGRATDVGRNPIVLGDAVAPYVQALAVNEDLRQGAGFYARNFTSINPHEPSAKGFALINVTNMNK